MLRNHNFVESSNVDDSVSVWPVFNRLPEPTSVVSLEISPALLPTLGAPAMPDVPSSLGILMFSIYIGLIGALALATSGPGMSRFMLVIASLFVVAFFTVPRFMFAQEPKIGTTPTMEHFLASGLNTYTGHCSGGAAMVQMFVVPVALTLGVLAMGLEIALFV